MRIAHFADLHLDAPFAWARHDVGRRRRQALRDCLQKIVAVATEERADAILCGGDLYEHEYATPDTRELLLSVLGATSIPVLIAPGNHDWLGPASLYRQADWPANVHVFTEPRLAPRELAPGLIVWGAAFISPTRSESFLVDAASRAASPDSVGFAPGRHSSPDSIGFAPSRATRSARGDVHLALFHGSAAGALPTANTDAYATFHADDILRCGFAHAFLGHYHQPADHPWYTYPGNPDPLEFGETGERGVVIAEIAADRSVRRRRRSVAVSAVHHLEVNLSACTHFQEVRERVAARLAGLAGVVRLDLCGELAPDLALDLDALAQPPDGIDQIVVRAGSLEPGYDFEALMKEPSVRGRFVEKVSADPTLDAAMKRRVLVTGLRALAGRDDLEAF